MRNRYAVVGVSAALILCGSAVHADHLPVNKFASGKPDSQVCGFDTYETPLKVIEARLGDPNGSERDPVHESGVTYRWQKGALVVLVKTYRIGKYQDRPPMWIEVSGNDPSRLCATGRGVALGDSLAAVRKAYGNRYGVMPLEDGRRMITVEWKTLQTMDIDVDKDGRVTRINVAGEIE